MSKLPKNFLDDIRSCCPDDILNYMTKHPPRRRASHISGFMLLAHQLDPEWHRKPGIITAACRKFLSKRREKIAEGKQQPVKEVTVISDYGAVRHYLSKLQKAKKLPINTFLPPVPSSSDVFTEKECNILGYSNLADALQAPSLEAALNDIARQIEQHRQVILAKCKNIVIDGYREFSKTQKMIQQSDITAIRKTSDNLDPNTTIRRSGQKVSFFSQSHPNGLINLIAYIAEEQGGLYTRKAFPGAHHAVAWSTSKIKQHLGITDHFAVAAMCIIVDELGINVTDLCNAKVQKTKFGEFIAIREDGGVTITTLKPRANALKERQAPRTIAPDDATVENLDANIALCMLLEMRSLHAKKLNSNYLFVMDSSSKTRASETEVYRMLDTKRKAAFKDIINSLPSWVIDAEPTMPKIRVSRGLLKWLESGGDAISTSIYLGNSLLTALRNYIPPEIQEFVHRKKLRDHQNIMLFVSDGASVAEGDKTGNAYDTTKEQVIALVKNIQRNSRLTGSRDANRLIYFLCSAKTIELIVSYAKYGHDKDLIETCKSIITKIEDEGSRNMIRMLADATPQNMNFDFIEEVMNEEA
ncbi:hypothetical protein ACX3YD_22960 [Pseudomonas fluorescens group sp. PF-1]